MSKNELPIIAKDRITFLEEDVPYCLDVGGLDCMTSLTLF